jgi:hypothetical protein
MAREAFLINPPKRLGRKRRTNPMGEEALILGGLNPKKGRRNSGYSKKSNKGGIIDMDKKKGRPRKKNPISALALNPKKSERKYYRNSPVKKEKRKRYRRNPAVISGGAISLKKPQTLIMPIATGVAAKMAVDRIPGMIKLTGNAQYLAQLAIAIGGGIMLPPVLGNTGAMIWLAVAGSTAITNFINTTMLKGLSDEEEIVYAPPSEEIVTMEGVEAYPELEGLSAYPEEI